MGLDLNAFGAGFFGQAVKDREANKEEERLANRQRLINKLNEESEIARAQRKTTAGTPYKVGDKYYVQDTDGDGNVKGQPREARPDEVRAYEAGDLDLRSKKAGTATAEFNASTMKDDHALDVEGKRLQQAQTKQEMQLARNRDARAAISERSLDSNSVSKKMEEIRQLQLEAEAAIEEMPANADTEAVRTTYISDVNNGVAAKVGFVEMRRRLNKVLATARGTNKRADAASKKEDGAQGLPARVGPQRPE